MQFEHIEPGQSRTMAVVGDSIAEAVGKPIGSYPALVWNVTDQPAGSDVFTAGTDVAHATAIAATFTASGWHTFTIAGANGESLKVDVVVFPAAALAVPQLKFQDTTRSQSRHSKEIRGSLRGLALHATKAGAEAALEAGAAVAPFYGTRPSTLGAPGGDSLRPFGGW